MTDTKEPTYSAVAADRCGEYAATRSLSFSEAVLAAVAYQKAVPSSAVRVYNDDLADVDHDGLTEEEREVVEDAIAPARRG